jgi:hypothetical protein
MRCRWLCMSWSRGCGWRDNFAGGRITGCCRSYYDLHRRDFHCRQCHIGLGLDRDGNRLFRPGFGRLNWFLNWCDRLRRRGLHGNGDRGRGTRHRLRRDEAWGWLRRLHRSNRRSTGCHCRWLGHAARRTRRHGRRRSHSLSWRRCRCCGNGGTRWDLRLGGLLRNRLQHVSRFRYVRQVDLGLKLVRLRARAAAAGGAAGLSVLSVILLDALRLIHFDGAGVRFLFRDPDLDQQVENHLAFDLEVPRQVVNSNLLQHSALFPPYCPVRLRVHSILTLRFADPRLDRAPGGPKALARFVKHREPSNLNVVRRAALRPARSRSQHSAARAW